MLFKSKINNDIEDNKELLYRFNSDYKAKTKVIIKNDNTPVIKMIKKNSSLLSLINTFDMEIESSTLQI
jgi:hypothetical protein